MESLTDHRPALREPAERVSPRARTMWRVAAATEGVVLVAVSAVADVIGWTPWWTTLVLAVVVGTWAVVVPQWRYLVHRWEVSETAVYTQTGWWTRERRIAPMSRIQTVDLIESAVSRLFGLATVTVTTASAAGALSIAGLDAARARQLVDELTVKADAVDGDAT